MLTHDVIELHFNTQNFTAKSWQYISLQLNDWKWLFYRNYSITDFTKDNFVLTIKLLSDWRWWKILKKLRLWKKLHFLWWLGSFTLQETEKTKVFFATGTWLSPMISMIKNTPESVKKIVYFWVREKKDIFYKKLLESFKNTEVNVLLSHKNETVNGQFPGRITEFVHKVTIDSEVYLCWNPIMVQEVTQILKEQWHPEKEIYSEWFVMWKEEKSIWKNIILKWNFPGTHFLDDYLPYLAVFGIPALYYYWTVNNILHKSGFLWDMSITTLLFALSWYCVVFVMLIRPISDLIPKIWLLRKLLILRKSVGIFWSSIIVTIFAFKYLASVENIYYYFEISNWNSLYPILSRLSELTWILLLITSNNFSQVKLGQYWKPIQRTAYIYFIAGWLVAGQWWSWYYYHILILWIILFISAWIKNRFFSKD
jgi:ferredoxin-NADP reductase/DMSO/TMAO reductase YedYZ heme-binding membrane subunit